MLSYLGSTWGMGDAPRFSSEQAIAYTRKMLNSGGCGYMGRSGAIARWTRFAPPD
jgi:hypothetical protein